MIEAAHSDFTNLENRFLLNSITELGEDLLLAVTQAANDAAHTGFHCSADKVQGAGCALCCCPR